VSVYSLGVDIGGTFTDVVSVDDAGRVRSTKVASTPPRFERGFIDGVGKLAGLHGTTADDFLRRCEIVLHGTTVATNAVVELRGARVGVLTTKGHRDTLPVMRGSGRSKGLPLDRMLHASRQEKPRPVAERGLILELNERMDARGQVVVALDDAEVEARVAELVDAGVDSIAVCLLWSVANPEHERRVAAAVRRLAPGVHVTSSHEVSSRSGEYERFAATAINAFIGPESAEYMRRLSGELDHRGCTGAFLIMQASGGVAPAEGAARLPILTIGSGPSAGLAASAVLAERRGEPNVITADMGGTSFDVGLVVGGQPVHSSSTVVSQYEFFIPRADIASIGSGGGSVVHHDPASRTLRVGPLSAGADPGPACYGRGGDRPTVTDANLVLGYLNPENFLGGEIPLDAARATAALADAGAPLGMDAMETAAAARRIVDAQMAELIRVMTVQRGMDPRDFAVYAYGGGGGLHVAGFTRELGSARAVVPLGELSAAWSAFGCATANLLHVHEHVETLASPLDAGRLGEIFAELEEAARSRLRDEGVPDDRQVLARAVDMKYPLQIHQVEVEAPAGALAADAGEVLAGRFAERYEQLFGAGAAFEGAGCQVVLCRVTGRGLLPRPDVLREGAGATDGDLASGRTREVVWVSPAETATLTTPILAVEDTAGGGTVEGPAIVEGASTTILVPPGTRGVVDPSGDLVLEPAAGGAA
jgi:N-methylhydantoinase A